MKYQCTVKDCKGASVTCCLKRLSCREVSLPFSMQMDRHSVERKVVRYHFEVVVDVWRALTYLYLYSAKL